MTLTDDCVVEKKSRMWLLAGYIMIISILSLMALTAPNPNNDLAVIVWPWSAPDRAAGVAVRSGALLVSGGRWPFVVIVRPSASGPGANSGSLLFNLYAHGALLVFDAGLVAGCR